MSNNGNSDSLTAHINKIIKLFSSMSAQDKGEVAAVLAIKNFGNLLYEYGDKIKEFSGEVVEGIVHDIYNPLPEVNVELSAEYWDTVLKKFLVDSQSSDNLNLELNKNDAQSAIRKVIDKAFKATESNTKKLLDNQQFYLEMFNLNNGHFTEAEYENMVHQYRVVYPKDVETLINKAARLLVEVNEIKLKAQIVKKAVKDVYSERSEYHAPFKEKVEKIYKRSWNGEQKKRDVKGNLNRLSIVAKKKLFKQITRVKHELMSELPVETINEVVTSSITLEDILKGVKWGEIRCYEEINARLEKEYPMAYGGMRTSPPSHSNSTTPFASMHLSSGHTSRELPNPQVPEPTNERHQV